MGYYTKFTIHDDSETLLIHIENVSNYSFYEEGGVIHSDDIKWYDHERDLSLISKENPDTIIKVSGQGEESGDLWVKYFKNGKVHRAIAKITFDPFDESKLTEVNKL